MNRADCTLERCSIQDAYMQCQPTIASNSVFLALFVLLGPVFFCAALSFLLGRIVITYHGEDISRLRRRNYLVSIGSATRTAADDAEKTQMVVNIMIASGFSKEKGHYTEIRHQEWKKVCLAGLIVATNDRLHTGPSSAWSNSTAGVKASWSTKKSIFKTLEGAMVSVCVYLFDICLTVLHPGRALGSSPAEGQRAGDGEKT
ncbi:hypothetical protein BDW75DRAFT_234548 [Aspergillus navahoensis]